MKIIIKATTYSLFLLLLIKLSLNNPVFAHPGRTAADGCHYCRTNCDRWGVPWNERHCHGGVVIPRTKPSPTPLNLSSNGSNTGGIEGIVLGFFLVAIGGGLSWLVRTVLRKLRSQTPQNEN